MCDMFTDQRIEDVLALSMPEPSPGTQQGDRQDEWQQATYALHPERDSTSTTSRSCGDATKFGTGTARTGKSGLEMLVVSLKVVIGR